MSGAVDDDRSVAPEPGWRAASAGRLAELLVLAIDTSTRIGGVALVRGDVVLAEDTWLVGGHHTAQTLPAVARLWDRAGLSVRDIDAIAVATGPGSFTGLRVGVSLAKGFAVALGVPLVGVATLDVVAYQHRSGAGGMRLCAVVDAGRDQLYIGLYRSRAGRLQRDGEFRVRSAVELAGDLAATRQRWFVAGELSAAYEAPLAAALGSRVVLASPAARLRRPAYLAELAQWRLASVGASDPAVLQPIYLRRVPGA